MHPEALSAEQAEELDPAHRRLREEPARRFNLGTREGWPPQTVSLPVIWSDEAVAEFMMPKLVCRRQRQAREAVCPRGRERGRLHCIISSAVPHCVQRQKTGCRVALSIRPHLSN
jgi:hypothetical protein